MEKYKKKLQAEIFWGKIYCGITAILILSIIITGIGENTNLLVSFLSGGMGSILYMIRKKSNTLKNEEALKKLYILDTDERIEQIATKASRMGIVFILIELNIAMIISTFFSNIVFYTLMLCEVCILITLFITTTFYNKKL